MARLIEKFASTLGASQRANVETLLAEGNIRGEVKSFDEFKAKLESLSTSINLEATPLTTIALVNPGQMITSASYNEILRLIRLDLQTVYTEIDNVFKLVDVHRSIQDKKARDIKDALAALDSSISTVELLSDDVTHGLAQFNTFNALGSATLSKLDPLATSLYIDPRTAENLINSIYEASIDATQEGLTLPVESSLANVIHDIVVEKGSDTTESDLDVDPADNETSYALNQDDGLYWVRSVLLLDRDAYGVQKSPPPNGAVTKIRVDLSGFQEVNSVKLVPFTDSSFTVDTVSYIDVDGGEFEISSSAIELSDATVITFSRVVTNTIYLNVRQKSYSELLDFYYSDNPATIDELRSFSSTSGLVPVEIGGDGGVSYARGFLYTIGFDYIGVFLSEYRELGIFVSQALSTTSQPTEMLVNAQVEHNLNAVGDRDDSVECYIAKLNYDSSGLLTKTEIFPIPFSTDAIVHEELLLSTGTGSTRFFPEYSSLSVYRDLSILTIGTDYQLSINGVDFRDSIAALSSDIATNSPQRLYVKILTPQPTAVYTTSYTPATEVNGSNIVLTADGLVEFAGRSVKFFYSPDTEIIRSDIYTIFILRTLNYSSGRESPIIFEYSTKVAES